MISSDFLEQFKEVQETNQFLQEKLRSRQEGKELEFKKDSGGTIMFKERISIPFFKT